jgi:RNA polymerase sigma-70 factor, ECF subfamily
MSGSDSIAQRLDLSRSVVAVNLPVQRSVAPDFDTLYEEYFHFVWRQARRMGVEPSAIDDVVQETFVVIHAKLPGLRSPDSLRSWVYGIVRRAAMEHRRIVRRAAKEAVLPAIPGTFGVSPLTPLEATELSCQRDLLENLLGGLSAPKREVFVLAELEEMSVPEIAEALDIPLNTAYSRLRHARQEFEAALDRQSDGVRKRGLE